MTRSSDSPPRSLFDPRAVGCRSSQVNVRKNKIFAIGGECDERKIRGELYTHYPRFAVVGEITVL